MYIKIFFENKPLFLCDEIEEILQPYIHHDDSVFIDELNSHTVKSMIREMELSQIHAGVFFHPSLDQLQKEFFKKFTLVEAAGGLVQNQKKEILLIYRRDKWDLPKGKRDKGETLEECAVREVEEETGLINIKLIAPLLITYHTYHEGTKFILKKSHWYKMRIKGEQKTIPQTEEDITLVKWIKPEQAVEYFSNTFPSVIDVIKEFTR